MHTLILSFYLSQYVIALGYYEDDDGRNALFNEIRALTQLNESCYIVTDYYNQCIRSVKSNGAGLWKTESYAGKCQSKGDEDGTLKDARFFFPSDIAKSSDVLYVTDYLNKKLKRIDMVTGMVSTVYHNTDFRLKRLTLGTAAYEFYTTVDNGVLHIENGTKNWLVGETDPGGGGETFDQARLRAPKDIKWMDEDVLLVIDGNSCLKVMNITAQSVLDICIGKH